MESSYTRSTQGIGTPIATLSTQGAKQSARGCNGTRRGCYCTHCTRLATGLLSQSQKYCRKILSGAPPRGGGPGPLEPKKHYIFRVSSVELLDLHLCRMCCKAFAVWEDRKGPQHGKELT